MKYEWGSNCWGPPPPHQKKLPSISPALLGLRQYKDNIKVWQVRKS